MFSNLKENNIDFKILKYIENPSSVYEIKIVLSKLKITPIELIRQKESIWIEQFKNKN